VNREQWLAERKKGLGSSDAPAVCNLSSWRTPLHVYLDKTGDLPDFDSPAKMWGRRLEALVADAYQEETGRRVFKPRAMLERHKAHPWMLASVDRYTHAETDGGWEERVLEIKTARFADGWGEQGTDEVPPAYLIQTMHQLAVTGLPAADLAVLIGGQELRAYTVRRDEALIANLVQILKDFWGRVERREPPEPSWEHPLTVELLRRTIPTVRGKEVQLPEECELWAYQYVQHGREMGEAKKLRAACQSRLMHALGDAEVGTVGKYTISRKTTRGGQRRFAVKEGTATEEDGPYGEDY
jgi:putative phage-type endonuclease